MNHLVGLDEAGRGPVLGPLVFGVCSVPATDVHLLAEQGVRDSKDLSPKKRKALEDWFTEQQQSRGWFGCTVTYHAERIDIALQNEGLNMLEVLGFREALEALPTHQQVDIVADACDVNAERFTRRITEGLVGWPWPSSTMVSEHKADQNHPVVAMASILAKEQREREMGAIQQRYRAPLGSGYPSDPATQQALNTLCPQEGIDPDVRWGWATVQRFWSEHREGDVPVRGQQRTVQQTLFREEGPRIS